MTRHVVALALVGGLVACGPGRTTDGAGGSEGTGADDGGPGDGDWGDDGSDDDGSDDDGSDGDGDGDGDGGTGTGTGTGTGGGGPCVSPSVWGPDFEPDPNVPWDCDEELTCEHDVDGDGVPLACDNDPESHNPDQGDMDGDGFGDVMDLCPTVASVNNTGDTDNDGIGNDCDRCRQTVAKYNEDAEDLSLPPYMYIRNIPFSDDLDQDGIGDVCDNCIHDANCEDYGPDNPYVIGDPILYDDPNVCQRDDNRQMIGTGTTCEQTTDDPITWIIPHAVGKVGFEHDDDFDQDGLENAVDACPRHPVAYQTCASDGDCQVAQCEDGICNHRDADSDGVGDICDTCPFKANPMQVAEGGAQEDDEDGDFVGNLCEADSECNDRKDPRPMGFYDVSVGGQCCVLLYPGDDLLVDPHGVPLRLECSDAEEATGVCRAVPQTVLDKPGMTELPPGCVEALDAAGVAEASRVTLDQAGDPNTLYEHACLMPARDQDFDGIGDACDLCPFSFDPTNAPYVDESGKLWPTYGKYCNGEYGVEACCEGAG